MAEVDKRATAERQTFWILVVISSWMTIWIIWRFLSEPVEYVDRSLGINENFAGGASWIWLPALAIVALYAAYTLWAVPGARSYVLRFNALGLVAVWAAVVSGILEEVLFRQRLMDWLDGLGHSAVTQVFISAVAFGAAHALWVLMACDWRIVVPVIGSTALLGLALAVLYIAADRSTLPAIAAHTMINLIIEPGLIATACLTGLRVRDGWTDSATEADAGRSAT